MFSFFNKKESDKYAINEKNNEKEISQKSEDIKNLQSNDTTNIISKYSFNNKYELPDIRLVDNGIIKEIIKEIIKNGQEKEIIIPLGLCDNGYYYESLESMPNLIVSGTVMSGKSSFIHTIIGTILLTKKPNKTKLLICDSKLIEYNQYNGIPHLMCPVITDSKQANIILKKIIKEIEIRYQMLVDTGTKKTEEYNNYIEKWNNTHLDKTKNKMPSIVIIIDDYDMISNNTIDDSIKNIAKKGWRVNVHLIIVSTHPSSEIISSTSKSLIPARLCFKVTSSKDSILILDDPIASKLAGIGKAAYVSRTVNVPKQLDSIMLNDEELKRLIDYTKAQKETNYDISLSNLASTSISGEGIYSEELDELFDEAVELVVSTNKASASMIQRKFRVGYNRAGRIIDELEKQGVIVKNNDLNNWQVVGRPTKNGHY